MQAPSDELTLCLTQLKVLIKKGNGPIHLAWEKFNPEAKDWNSTAENYLAAYEWSGELTANSPPNSKGFLYQNSLASCKQFTSTYSRQLFYQKAIFSSSVLILILLLGVFWRIRYSRRP